MFLPREEELQLGRLWELYKIDLHVPPSMRKEDQLLRAEQAADAAKLYLQTMQTVYGMYTLAADVGSDILQIAIWGSCCPAYKTVVRHVH